MFDFVQKFIYFAIAIQEKVLGKKLKRSFGLSYSNSTSKRVFGVAASLNLTVETEKSKEKLERNAKVILKKYENNPEKLLQFIEGSGTKIYKIACADKVLKIIGYEEGFIGKINGLKGLYINTIVKALAGEKINLSFKTKPMFILRDMPLDSYYMIQQFYKWYAMKLNLPGFDYESQENFQKFLSSNDEKIDELSIEEILGLKEAIARDVEAINFVIDLAKSTEGSKNAMKKITAGGASV